MAWKMCSLLMSLAMMCGAPLVTLNVLPLGPWMVCSRPSKHEKGMER
jgi:hypothetical protein